MSTTNNNNVIIKKATIKPAYYLNEEVEFILDIINTTENIIYDIVINDTLNDFFFLVENSLFINNIPSNNNLNNIIINELFPNKNVQIRYKATVTKQNVYTISKAHMQYKSPQTNTITNVSSNEFILDIYPEKELADTGVYSKSHPYVKFTTAASHTKAYIGDTVTFTITLENISNVELKEINIIDNLDPFFTYIDKSTKINNIVNMEANQNMFFASLKPQEKIIITFETIVNTPYLQIPNTAVMSAYYTEAEGEKVINIATNEIYIDLLSEPFFDIVLTKSTKALTYYQNEIVSFSIALKNNSNITIDKIILNDILDNRFALIENSISLDNQITNLNSLDNIVLTNILPNVTKSVSFNVVAIETGNNIINQAKATATYYLKDVLKTTELESNEISLNIIPRIIPQIDVVKKVTKTQLNLKEEVTMTINLTNNSTFEIRNINIYDIIEPYFKLIDNSLLINDMSYSPSVNNIIFIDNIKPNQIINITYKAIASKVSDSLINKSIIEFEYTDEVGIIKNNTIESNELIFKITEEKIANVKINKQSNKINYALNEEITFEIILENIGNAIATNLRLEDILDSSYTFIKDSLKINDIPNKNTPNQVVIDSLMTGEIKKITFKVIPTTYKNNIINEANLTYNYTNSLGQQEVFVKSNTISNNIIMLVKPIIEINKTIDYQTSVIDDEVTFSLTITNSGNLEAKNIIISDIIDPSYQYILTSLTLDNQIIPEDNLENIKISNLNPNETKTILFKAKAIKPKNNINNQANLTFEYLTNNSEVIIENVNSNILITNIYPKTEATIIIKNTLTKPYTFLNEENMITLIVKNIGNTKATNIYITNLIDEKYEIISNSLTINNISSSNLANEDIYIEELNSNEEVTLTFKIKAISLGNNIPTFARANYEFENALKQNIVEAIYALREFSDIIIRKEARLKISKTSQKSSLILNEENIFTITVENIGNTIAENMIIQDFLPREFSLANEEFFLDDNLMLGNIESGIMIDELFPNTKKTISFKVIAKEFKFGIENIATVSYKYIDSFNNIVNDIDYSNIVLVNIISTIEAILEITNSIDSTNTTLQDIAKFKLIVKNIGNAPAENINIIEKLPNNYQFIKNSVRIDDIQTNNDIKEKIFLKEIMPNKEVVITFEAKGILLGKNIKSQASSTYSYHDLQGQTVNSSSTSNQLITNVLIADIANLIVSKKAIPNVVRINDIAKYQIDIINDSKVDATNIILNDILPINLKLITDSFQLNSKNMSTNGMPLKIDKIMPQEKVTVEFLTKALIKGNNINNIANVSYSYPSLSSYLLAENSTNSNDCHLDILDYLKPNVNLNLTLSNTNSSVNEITTFTYQLTNSSNVDITNIKLTNFLHPNYSLMDKQILIDNLIVLHNEQQEVLTIPKVLKNSSIKISFQARAIKSAINLTHIASATYNYLDNNILMLAGISSKAMTSNIFIEKISLIKIEKTISPTTSLNKNELVTIKLSNPSDIKLVNIKLKDIIDEAFSINKNTLKINNVLSNDDIITTLKIAKLEKDEEIIISYELKSIMLKDKAITKTIIEYNLDKAEDQIFENEISTFTDILDSFIPNVEVILDSNTKIVEKGEFQPFKIAITNYSSFDLDDVFIKILFDNAYYQGIEDSLLINGQTKITKLNDNIMIKKINKHETIYITFYLLTTDVASEALVKSTIGYTYTDEENNLIDEEIDSNHYISKIVSKDIPLIEIKKHSLNQTFMSNTPNTFEISLENVSSVWTYDLEIIDILHSNYSYLENSLKIDGKSVNYQPNYVLIQALPPLSKTIITFDVMAKKEHKNIENKALVYYKYRNNQNNVVMMSAISSSIFNSIISKYNPALIDILHSISLTEYALVNLIVAEKSKLIATIKKSNAPQAIIDVNNSILKLIKNLIITETSLVDKVKIVLDKL